MTTKAATTKAATTKTTTTKPKAETPKAEEKPPKTPRQPLEKVEPARFLKVIEDLGLSRREAAEAIGRSMSRISELTYSQGASVVTFEAFVKACEAYAKKHPRPVQQEAAAE